MQFDTLRAFPYPVLRPGVDDYIEGALQVTVDLQTSEDGHQVSASISTVLSVPELRSLIEGGLAEYVVVFACRDTYFRHVEQFSGESADVSFPPGSLRGEVQISSYVVATKAINGYACGWINPEFGSGPFSYAMGDLLALDEPLVIFIDRDVFRPLSSMFVLVKDEALAGYEWQVKPSADKVQISTSPELKEKIDVARNSKANKAVLLNSIYFAAVMQAITWIKNDPDEHSDSRWAKVITEKCHNEGIDLAAHDEHLVAERLMKSPFQRLDAYVFKGVEQ